MRIEYLIEILQKSFLLGFALSILLMIIPSDIVSPHMLTRSLLINTTNSFTNFKKRVLVIKMF